MFKILAGLAVLGLQLCAGEFHASNEVSLYYNKVTGPGKANSSLTENLNYADLLSLNGSGEKGKASYNYNMGFKSTDDPRTDIKNVSLTNLNGYIKNGPHNLNAGDIFESFSQYSLATALKGGSYRYENASSALGQATVLFGYASPRWDSFWKDPLTRTQKKQAWGARLKKNLSGNLDLGLSMVNSKDVDSYNSTSRYEVSNLAMDFSFKPAPGLSFDGEAASSDYDENVSKASENGKAFRLQATGDADPSRVSVEYEEVSPDFLSPLGSSTPDRRKVKTKWRYKYSKYTTFNTGLLWYRNNLDGQLASTTKNWRPEVSMAVKKIFPSRPYSFADFSYKFDRKYGAGSSQADHYFNINYRDRLSEMDSDSNLGYTIYRTKTSVRDSREFNFNTSLSERLEKADSVFTPKITAGAWYSKDELSDYSDKVYEYSLGLGFEKPQNGFSSEIRLGQNFLRKGDPTSDDSAKTFASASLYYRTKIMKAASVIFLKAAFNDFNYSTNANDFREKSVTLGLNTSF
ncbi:MAG: hypothetical protein Fur0012_14670 [Elusimicrobiota bacterium]